MAAPVAPTASSLISEALSKAGYAAPSAALTARGTVWLEEIKNDIYEKQRKLKGLQTKAIQPLTVGLPQYANPSDFSSDLGLEFATGVRYGTAQAGSTTSVTLAATETAAQSDLLGKEIAITGGAGPNQISYITAYNSTTKVATVSPAFAVAPDVTSTYVILDDYRPVEERNIRELGMLDSPTEQSYPEKYFPIGDAVSGSYILYPVPYRSDAQPMVLIQRYYANLQKLDLSSALLAVLYQRWYKVWMAGLVWMARDDADDDKADASLISYRHELKRLVESEGYFNTLVNPQAQVTDY